MNCLDYQELLVDWLDGALPHDEHVAVSAHVAQCADCQAEVDEWRAVFGALRRALRHPYPVAAYTPLQEAIEPVPLTPWERVSPAITHLAAAASVAVIAATAAVTGPTAANMSSQAALGALSHSEWGQAVVQRREQLAEVSAWLDGAGSSVAPSEDTQLPPADDAPLAGNQYSQSGDGF
ncbi:MAG: anti-sigma factor family protein, partial [Candidatus Hydrogenedentota bacterium]